MLKPTQLGFVSLQVRDLEVSRQFYTNVLGFQPAAQSPFNACVFEMQSGASFAIRKSLIDLEATTRVGWGVSLWFGVADLAAFLQRLEGDASLIRGVEASLFGNTAIVADPDGYWLTLQETPGA